MSDTTLFATQVTAENIDDFRTAIASGYLPFDIPTPALDSYVIWTVDEPKNRNFQEMSAEEFVKTFSVDHGQTYIPHAASKLKLHPVTKF